MHQFQKVAPCLMLACHENEFKNTPGPKNSLKRNKKNKIKMDDDDGDDGDDDGVVFLFRSKPFFLWLLWLLGSRSRALSARASSFNIRPRGTFTSCASCSRHAAISFKMQRVRGL